MPNKNVIVNIFEWITINELHLLEPAPEPDHGKKCFARSRIETGIVKKYFWKHNKDIYM
jgi:hypothetical protein